MFRLTRASKLIRIYRKPRHLSTTSRLWDESTNETLDDEIGEPAELGIDESWKAPKQEFPEPHPFKKIRIKFDPEWFYEGAEPLELGEGEEKWMIPQVTRTHGAKTDEIVEKGDFKQNKSQGYGNRDQISDMWWPEWRTSYSVRDRYLVRPNSSYMEQVYDGHWAEVKRDEDEIEKIMDIQWDAYVEQFGMTPSEYIGSPAYKAKYGDMEKCWHDYVKNRRQHSWSQQARNACFTPAHTTQNACPLHRDYQLLVHYKNIPLLEQFLCEFTGNVIAPLRSGLCHQATLEVEWALRLAYDKGYLLQPLRTYSPGAGWGLGRPDFSDKLYRPDKTVHFR